MLDILAEELDSHSDAAGVIFDGFPRTIPQAEGVAWTSGRKRI